LVLVVLPFVKASSWGAHCQARTIRVICRKWVFLNSDSLGGERGDGVERRRETGLRAPNIQERGTNNLHPATETAGGIDDGAAAVN
jgi:hypothetical protein